jgi:hypothetical protein
MFQTTNQIRWCPIYPKWDSYQPLFQPSEKYLQSTDVRGRPIIVRGRPMSCSKKATPLASSKTKCKCLWADHQWSSPVGPWVPSFVKMESRKRCWPRGKLLDYDSESGFKMDKVNLLRPDTMLFLHHLGACEFIMYHQLQKWKNPWKISAISGNKK